MRDPYPTRLTARPSLRPTTAERVHVLIASLVFASAAIVVVSFVIAAFVAVGLTTPRGQFAAALCVLGGAIGGWAWRTR